MMHLFTDVQFCSLLCCRGVRRGKAFSLRYVMRAVVHLTKWLEKYYQQDFTLLFLALKK